MLTKIQQSAKLLFRSQAKFSSSQVLYTEPTMKEKFDLLKQEHIPVVATGRQVYDLALILNGGFNPVNSFMNEKEYNSVVHDFRMPDGQLFSLPIYFDIDAETKAEVEKTGKPILISDEYGNQIAFLHATEIYKLNKQEEGQHVYGGDKDHCEIININQNIKEFAVAGRIQLINNVQFPEFTNGYTKGPEEVKELFKQKGWEKIVAFQTRNPMHYAHIELTKRAQEQLGAALYLNPVIGPTKPGDIDASTRMKCYHAIKSDYNQDQFLLNTLPLAMRMGGPREAMMHAIIRKNYGCTHFIVGRDHAGPGSNSAGEDIYDAFAARDFVVENQKELGISAVAFDEMVYVEEEKKYFPKPELNGRKGLKLSGTEVRRRLGTGEEIPSWFSNPKVVSILRENALQKKMAALSAQAEQETPAELVKKALEMYGEECAISFSGAEDVLLIEYAKQSGLPFRVFSLDTGRLHPETYEYFERVEKHYGIKIEYTFPDTEETKNLVNTKGMFSFYQDGHKECCTVRKVGPLKQKLGSLKAWITGIRKDQSQTRTEIDMVSVDPSFKGAENGPLIKFNPLTNSSSKQVWSEIVENSVPFNDLHLQGFVSIGCQPCTNPTHPGQHERQGRWAWEDVSQKECGLHAAKGKQ